jgi:hypothetical protein
VQEDVMSDGRRGFFKLAPNLGDVLFTLDFHNLGIFKLASETVEAGDQVPRVRAEMYCQQMTFTPGTGVGG